MRILPVIDLKAGLVVRGIGGRRAEYQPVQSVLCDDPRPATVARAFAQLGLSEVYVADLDAILGAEPAHALYAEIAAEGLQPMLDCGRPIDTPHTLILGMETLAAPLVLSATLAQYGPRRTIFSLDLKAGRPLTTWPAWCEQAPATIAAEVLALGIERMIVLDLAQVGEGRGVGTLPLVRSIRALSSRLELIAGGGVRNEEDLVALADAGCDAALVASALHDGRVDVRRWVSGSLPRPLAGG